VTSAPPFSPAHGAVHTVPAARRVDPLSLPALVAELAAVGGAVVSVEGWRVAVADPVATIDRLDELAALDDLGPATEPPDDLPPLAAGWVGAITDAVSRPLLSLPPDDPRPQLAPLPPLWFGCYDSALVVDPDGRAWGTAADLPASGPASATQRAQRWARHAEALAARHDRPREGGFGAPLDEVATAHRGHGGAPTPPQWSLPEEAHQAAVRRAQAWIAAGDCYQINLTAQASAPWPASGEALARALWHTSPAAHAAFLQLPGGVEVVSISPETLLRVRGRIAAVRPIKGTRPRRADQAADTTQARMLRASAKDAAEHVMIVDLERNDLGRVCRSGTVRVPHLAALEAHPSVWHLTSTVTGELAARVGVAELVAATFPAASVVGAPKRRAWQRASQLEPVRRGVYCGAIGAITPRGADLSVAIRTAVAHGGWASYGAGGGIVADSDPDAERQEAVDKAKPFLDAIACAPMGRALS
jgi:para-aminobenzoate synthetase component 1